MDWLEKLINQMDLSVFKYKNILQQNGGPILKIDLCEFFEDDGNKIYEATTYLDEKSLSITPVKSKIYDNPSGTGTSNNKHTAIHKSISEAIERWAFEVFRKECSSCFLNSKISNSQLQTSCGYAAYPGLTTYESKIRARLEAVERWSLNEWWLGKLSSFQYKGLNQICDKNLQSLIIPVKKSFVSITYSKVTRNNQSYYCFGFACAKTIKDSIEKSKIEMSRNKFVLERYYKNQISLDSLQDKRLVYFSTDRGFEDFQYRVDQSRKINQTNVSPEFVFDSEIKGPWSKYSTVWRSLCKETESTSKLSSINFFFF
jgi:hypothetical protein